jgi:hypothetical protein
MSQGFDLGVGIAAEYERDDLDSSLSPRIQHDEAQYHSPGVGFITAVSCFNSTAS